MKLPEYENYHCHSTYSNCLTQPDSTMSIEDYAKVYRQRDMHVLCISEHGNRSNVWQQAELAKKYSDDTFKMVPLAAAECYFVPDRKGWEEMVLDKNGFDKAVIKHDARNFHLILVAKDMEGFYQLNEALSEANLTGFYYKARVDLDILSKLDYRHFVCTTACVAGPVRDENAEQYCLSLRDIFKENFYLEVQHHQQQIQKEHNQKILQIYRKTGIPLIYATDSHYIRHEDAQLRKELLLSSGIKTDYEDEFDLYLPTAQEAYNLMLAQGVLSKAQIEEAMENTLQFRDFEGVSFTTEKKIPNSRPNLSLEKRNYLYKKEVCDGYMQKAGMPSKEEAEQLHAEMDAVVDTGTADYFITMKDIVDKGIANGGVLTTTGRGSGVSFATNFALGFTSINRLKCPVRLYPDRFISKERLASGSLPDLDLNMSNVEAFEKAGKEILGDWGCLPMIAYGTCKTLSAFKLLARARNLDFEVANIVSKQISSYERALKYAKENDEEEDAAEQVRIEDYVEQEYLSLIEESAQYKGIITTIVPHPCAHILLDRDIRREIGIVRVKAKTGKKEAIYAAYIDGQLADAYGYLKADYLRVDVVKTIDASFKACDMSVMPVNELLENVKNDDRVWQLYANGFTMGLNQVEKDKTTERVMRYKPKNVVELAAFVAAVRPGFKSMLETFVNRRHFEYGIPSLDKLLMTKEIPSSFLMYDEQILRILQAAGIEPADAYTCVKAIKKKKAEKVKSYKERFESGFTKVLKEQEGASEEEAKETVDKIWTIINDAASYMFCAAHAFSMACDSLYAAWLKVHHPYEFYATMLKIYTEKGNKDKIAAISSEMYKYLGIAVTAGKFGQDNSDWFIDKEHKRIAQNISSVKFVSSGVAKTLLALSKRHFDTFTDLLRTIQMETSINTRQLSVLISLDYFSDFGKIGKLMKVFNHFFESDDKLTKSYATKTVEKRMEANREYERSLEDEELPIGQRLAAEYEYIGRCVSKDDHANSKLYFVESVDDTFGVRVSLYSVQRGTVGIMKARKNVFEKNEIKPGQLLTLKKWEQRQRYSYLNDGTRKAINGTFDYWMQDYETKDVA